MLSQIINIIIYIYTHIFYTYYKSVNNHLSFTYFF